MSREAVVVVERLLMDQMVRLVVEEEVLVVLLERLERQEQ